MDPLTSSYPYYTPYQFAGNKPISFIDLDGLEEANPQQIKAAMEYFNNTKIVQSDVFTGISPKLINDQLHKRIKFLGDGIKQGDYYLCGPAAACHIAASHDPLQYTKLIFELYKNGNANNKLIKGTKEIFEKAQPDANGNIEGIPAVDWIILHSLRYSENVSMSYDPCETNDISKMTLNYEFSDLLERTGAKASIENSGSLNESSLNTVTLKLKENKRVVLFVDSRQYNNAGYSGFFDKLVSQSYGRHFIVVENITISKDGKANVYYWDKGKSGIEDIEFENIEAFLKASLDFHIIKNNSNE